MGETEKGKERKKREQEMRSVTHPPFRPYHGLEKRKIFFGDSSTLYPVVLEYFSPSITGGGYISPFQNDFPDFCSYLPPLSDHIVVSKVFHKKKILTRNVEVLTGNPVIPMKNKTKFHLGGTTNPWDMRQRSSQNKGRSGGMKQQWSRIHVGRRTSPKGR